MDTVKIDRSYVINIENDAKDKNTVRFISDLSKSFSAEVCVEGIENSGFPGGVLPIGVVCGC